MAPWTRTSDGLGSSGFNQSCIVSRPFKSCDCDGVKDSTWKAVAPLNAAAKTGCSIERVRVIAAVFAETLNGLGSEAETFPFFAHVSAIISLPRYCAAW